MAFDPLLGVHLVPEDLGDVGFPPDLVVGKVVFDQFVPVHPFSDGVAFDSASVFHPVSDEFAVHPGFCGDGCLSFPTRQWYLCLDLTLQL